MQPNMAYDCGGRLHPAPRNKAAIPSVTDMLVTDGIAALKMVTYGRSITRLLSVAGW